MRRFLTRGTVADESIHTVRSLVTTDGQMGNLRLKRGNDASESDIFNVFPFPVPAVNPSLSKADDLYIVYADKGEASGDKADIFFLRSADGGVNWDNGTPGITTPKRVNTIASNDQWMPVLAVKPDGTKLFVAWYDRQHDANNSLIDVYGRWADIAADGTVTFGTEFKITSTSFPPVFSGTLPANTGQGHYDPAYPPAIENLKWRYPEWPESFPPDPFTAPHLRSHVGEYNGAWSEGLYVYVSWTDNRLLSIGTQQQRRQSDVRFLRLTWP